MRTSGGEEMVVRGGTVRGGGGWSGVGERVWWVVGGVRACVMVCTVLASEIACMHAIKALLILYFKVL